MINPKGTKEQQSAGTKLFVKEVNRIKSLVFLEDITPPIPPLLYYFHPVTFVEYMNDDTNNVQLQDLTAKYPDKIRKIVLHCSATQENKHYTVENIRQWHKNQGWSDIGYHYVVYLDGSLHFGRPENIRGSHVLNYNHDSISIVYIGGVDDSNNAKDTRTLKQKEMLHNVVRALLRRYPNATVHGHRELYSGKACPSFDVQVDFGKYNIGKTPNMETSSGTNNNAF